ncbi:putative elongation factor 1-gamma 1 [Gregarina niphandrodes]|uniref:Elongation factor 1-gamma 1 n=1 Tax=Gregarina niphandrodes TaxID=110365 RepID=A0A023B6V5_GRENI|nr:putative elongation factor 1-gamma 1 [Gregarina niphandrodes]EZG66799.1 putative elongation factor 1-gamma 1 [Gregarina niphandrodes]|eukprot:XP_011130481.1 putative elongation factor 1-gamma 1 [Gregarina niphandrodes]
MTPTGLVTGSMACLRYFGNAFPLSGLYGNGIKERAEVDSALDAIHLELEIPSIMCKKGSVAKEAVEQQVSPVLSRIDSKMGKSGHVVGSKLTLADLALAGAVQLMTKETIVKTEGLKNIAKLLDTVHKVGEKPEPKAGKKVEAAAENVDEEKPVEKPAAKPVRPSYKYDMDAWKRYYSNCKDLRGDAMKYFWDKYDEEECSLWKVKYLRYNDQDNVEAFKASNLLGMFYQRIDNYVRKIGFAVCDILKRDGYYDIEGVLFCLGHDLPTELKEHDQFSSFTWDKLTMPECKQLVEDYFCEEDKLEGAEIADCKVYK